MRLIHCDKCKREISDEAHKNKIWQHKITIDERHHPLDTYPEYNVELCECCYKKLLSFLGIEAK